MAKKIQTPVVPGAPTNLPRGYTGIPLGTEQQRNIGSMAGNQALQLLQQLSQQQMQRQQTPFDFAPIAQQARSQFQQQTIPSIAERFTSMGGYGTGALSSPAFASQLGAAGAGLEQGLAALQSQYGLQQQELGQGQQRLDQNLLQMLLGLSQEPQFGLYRQPQQPSMFSSLGNIVKFGTSLLPGGNILSGLGSLFGRGG